jgi:hypothetical protein
VLSTLSVDVQGLKHAEGVRYLLCTDLKRCPEWVTNGQHFLEANQQRSWCWQRAWDPTPIRNAPVELEAAIMPDRSPLPQERERSDTQTRNAEYTQSSSPPPQRPLPGAPLGLDGAALMQNDIARISEKIDSLSMSHNASRMLRQEYERRRENEKVLGSSNRREVTMSASTFATCAPTSLTDWLSTSTHPVNFRPGVTWRGTTTGRCMRTDRFRRLGARSGARRQSAQIWEGIPSALPRWDFHHRPVTVLERGRGAAQDRLGMGVRS